MRNDRTEPSPLTEQETDAVVGGGAFAKVTAMETDVVDETSTAAKKPSSISIETHTVRIG